LESCLNRRSAANQKIDDDDIKALSDKLQLSVTLIKYFFERAATTKKRTFLAFQEHQHTKKLKNMTITRRRRKNNQPSSEPIQNSDSRSRVQMLLSSKSMSIKPGDDDQDNVQVNMPVPSITPRTSRNNWTHQEDRLLGFFLYKIHIMI
jgi:hypothetical protein